MADIETLYKSRFPECEMISEVNISERAIHQCNFIQGCWRSYQLFLLYDHDVKLFLLGHRLSLGR